MLTHKPPGLWLFFIFGAFPETQVMWACWLCIHSCNLFFPSVRVVVFLVRNIQTFGLFLLLFFFFCLYSDNCFGPWGRNSPQSQGIRVFSWFFTFKLIPPDGRPESGRDLPFFPSLETEVPPTTFRSGPRVTFSIPPHPMSNRGRCACSFFPSSFFLRYEPLEAFQS